MGPIRVLQPDELSFDFSLSNQVIIPDTLTRYSLTLPANTIGAGIFIEPNDQSPAPFPNNLPIYVRKADFPTTNIYDFVTWNNGVAIPPDGPANYLQTIQNLGFFYSVGNTNNDSGRIRPDHRNHHDERSRKLFPGVQQFEPVHRHEQSGTATKRAGSVLPL